MTVKTESKLLPTLLTSRQYSGMMATLIYNWPIFAGIALFTTVVIGASFIVSTPWRELFLLSGIGGVVWAMIILLASFLVYDWGNQHEYDRLAELGELEKANMMVDITCGKLRGSRGILPRFKGGHYFLIDIYDEAKMSDNALKRARSMEPTLKTERRIYHRTGKPNRFPLPHNWADAIYCSFSLHELQDKADREAIFKEFARMLKPKGRLLIAEHGRDLSNAIAFGPGVYSFFSPSTWQIHFESAGLKVAHHERWRGLVNLWVIEKD
ncbi:class I SAM-dependent methyltransferase [Anaerolineales bacterium HSG24]|nr:class I SAM-dependent methyltransferase [Anaerolineales bacterium HSG24]